MTFARLEKEELTKDPATHPDWLDRAGRARVDSTASSRDTAVLGVDSTQVLESNGVRRPLIAANEKSQILDEALQEFRELRVRTTDIDLDLFAARYPEYCKSVRRLIDVELTLGSIFAFEDPFPSSGDLFADCVIGRLLGVGASARVYLASDQTRGERPVVLKVAMRGEREAASIGRLRHPNIVDIEGVRTDPDSGLAAIVMPYQGEATLTDLLDKAFKRGASFPTSARLIPSVGRSLANKRLFPEDPTASPAPEVLRSGSYVDGVVYLAQRICAALMHAHGQRVWHHDLKPSNILLTPGGEPVLLDFNLAADESQRQASSGGTLPYMAPEQILAKRYSRRDAASSEDPRADVFSLGVILFELLSGQLPFPRPLGDSASNEQVEYQLRAVKSAVPSLRDLNPDVPPELETIVRRCLALNPAKRYQTVAELARELKELGEPSSLRKASSRECRAIVSGVSVAALLVLLAAGGSWGTLLTGKTQRLAEARIAYLEQRYQEVIQITTRFIEEFGGSFEAHLMRGLAHVRLEHYRHEQTVKDLELANAAHPTVSGLLALSATYGLNERRAEGKMAFESALALDPDDFQVQYHLAARNQRNDLAVAHAAAKTCYEQQPDNWNAASLYAVILHNLGEYETAIQILEDQVKRHENSLECLSCLALKYRGFWKIPAHAHFRKRYRERYQEVTNELAIRGVSRDAVPLRFPEGKYREPWMDEVLELATGSLSGYEDQSKSESRYPLPKQDGSRYLSRR